MKIKALFKILIENLNKNQIFLQLLPMKIKKKKRRKKRKRKKN
jgi:hypothetical protein